jgi:hypothetical protein
MLMDRRRSNILWRVGLELRHEARTVSLLRCATCA